MWYASGAYKNNQNLLCYKIPTASGQSGCPIIKRVKGKEYVIGVHLGKISGSKRRNIGIRITQEKIKKINEWVSKITSRLKLSNSEII